MRTRPYSSLSGARMSGPQAKPSTKMDTTKVAKVVEVVLNSCITSCTAGESMEDMRGLVMLDVLSKVKIIWTVPFTYTRKLITEMVMILNHFLLDDQFIGFSGS